MQMCFWNVDKSIFENIGMMLDINKNEDYTIGKINGKFFINMKNKKI